MPRPRTGRPRVEDCVALRAAVVVRSDGSLGRGAFGSAELCDPVTGAPAGTVAWRTELLAWGSAWVHVAHRRAGQAWDSVAYRLDLDRAAGAVGMRWRLWCPLSGRPTRALYLPNLESSFGSREAHGLAYGSQGMSPARRAETRARRIRVALGGSADLAAPFPPRPRGMWARTYERRCAEALGPAAAGPSSGIA